MIDKNRSYRHRSFVSEYDTTDQPKTGMVHKIKNERTWSPVSIS
jgi:hypothetical protein